MFITGFLIKIMTPAQLEQIQINSVLGYQTDTISCSYVKTCYNSAQKSVSIFFFYDYQENGCLKGKLLPFGIFFINAGFCDISPLSYVLHKFTTCNVLSNQF